MKHFLESFGRFAVQNKLLPKLVCLFLSVLLWAFIGNRQSGRIMFRVPIDFKNLSEGLIISDYSDKYVFVSLEGKKEYLKGVTMKNVEAFVDLSNAIIGESKNYTLDFDRHQLPESVSLNPAEREVSLTIERIRNKWVKVVPRIVGAASSGKIIGKIKVYPEYVMISGPASQIEGILSVKTDEISLADEYEDLDRNVELDQSDFRFVKISETTIRVTVPIVKNDNVYAVEVPVSVYRVDERFKADTGDLKVRVYFRSDSGSKYNSDDLEAYADAGGVNYQQIVKNGSGMFEKTLPVLVRLKSRKSIEGEVVTFLPDAVDITLTRK